MFFFGNDIKGIYRVPEFTDIQAASLVRINLFTKDTADSGASGTLFDFFQIVPDVRLFQDANQIRNISPAVINLQGAPRN
jgi:hypothetical protein